ncbi:MAG: hypothetical protein H6672_23115, partial [Anaerolineaceae bacterium]|nr:hypothetical protein [Anaerolineaceae bacterium]
GKRTQDSVVFKGVAGETVTLTAQIASGWETAQPYVEVLQNGNSLAYETLSGDAVYRIEVTVPESGIVSVMVSDYSDGPTVVELHLLRPGE